MDAQPGIVFRDGPAGRRAALEGGLDVWEVVRVVKNVERRGEDAIDEAADWLGISRLQVSVAVDYYAANRDEIDRHLELVDGAAEAAEEAAERRQAVLG